MPLLRVIPLALAVASLVPALPSAAQAQAPGVFVFGGNGARDRDERVPFTWSGRVDREVVLTMRGRRVDVRGERSVFGNRDGSARATATLPREPGDVRLRLAEGRGDVDILQRPSARNDWTLVVRIRDPRGGDDRYRLSAFWFGDDRGGWGRNDDWGRDRGRNDDRGRNRGRDRDRDGDWDRDDDWGRDGGWGRNDDWGRDVRSVATWSGIVDDDVELRIQGRNIRVIDRNGAPTRSVRSTVAQPLGRNDAVRIVAARGRGSVGVVQQPAPWNGYTAIVRIRDRQGGADRYDVRLDW